MKYCVVWGFAGYYTRKTNTIIVFVIIIFSTLLVVRVQHLFYQDFEGGMFSKLPLEGNIFLGFSVELETVDFGFIRLIPKVNLIR